MTDDADPAIYKTLVENSMDTLVLATPELQRIYVSPSSIDVMGYAADTLIGKTPSHIIHPEDRAGVLASIGTLAPDAPTNTVAWRAVLADGTHRWLETTYRRLEDGRIVAVIRNIQRRKEVEAQLEAALKRLELLVMVDPLTEIPNRRYFLEAVERHLCAAETRPVTLLLVDLDGFKPINDMRGHAVGDAVLVIVARRLLSLATTPEMPEVETTWIVARLGGDEFAVLLTGAAALQSDLAARRIAHAIMEPIVVDGTSISLTASVGVAHALSGGDDPKAMLLRADLAMYQAKRQGGAGHCTFGEENARPIAEAEWGWMQKAKAGSRSYRRRGADPVVRSF
jgi:diguanylate cyclase (GGDEF)-like protein/PAS domain S-box-containing protein